MCLYLLLFFKQKRAYDMRIIDWSSDVCTSDLARGRRRHAGADEQPVANRLRLHRTDLALVATVARAPIDARDPLIEATQQIAIIEHTPRRVLGTGSIVAVGDRIAQRAGIDAERERHRRADDPQPRPRDHHAETQIRTPPPTQDTQAVPRDL